MPQTRAQTVLVLIVAAVGLLIAAILGLFAYMSATATTLHPDPQDVPSVTHSAPSPQWAAAVEQARQIVRARLIEQNLPGLSVAVGVGGDIVWAEGFGWADLENRVPVAPDMRFRIGTASMALTSAAAGLLLEKGRLKLDDEIQTYVPEFPGKQWPMTLRQLMGHWPASEPTAVTRGRVRRTASVRSKGCSIRGESLLFEPGTRYRSSSYGWILVSAAVEAAADEPFFTFMRRQIFEPLGMSDTRADSATEPIPDRVTSYFPRFAADPRYGLHLMRPIDYSCYTGSSVFLSTPSDLVRFGMAINSGKLLQPATVQLLQTSQRLASGEETGYGLGWDLETVTLAGNKRAWSATTATIGRDGGVSHDAPRARDRRRGDVEHSYTDTFALGVKISQAFVEQGGRQDASDAPPRLDIGQHCATNSYLLTKPPPSR